MIRIAISCGEGFSSGFLANRLQEEVVKNHLEDTVNFKRIPFYQLHDHEKEVDIAMIMPHIEWEVNASKDVFHIPLYIIPYKVIVKPSVYDFIEDAGDILLLADGKGGKIHFPDEPKAVNVTRLCSHRKWLAQQREKEK